MSDFKKLLAWQRSRELVSELHSTFRVSAASFPGLRGQILRAATSVSSNLAEGCARGSRAELARFARIAYGSLKEVESQLINARDAELISEARLNDLLALTDGVARLCYGLARSPSATRRTDALPPPDQ